MDINQASLQMHYDLHGKIEVISRKKIETREDLSLAYTPGVAEPCRVIAKDYEQSFIPCGNFFLWKSLFRPFSAAFSSPSSLARPSPSRRVEPLMCGP